VFDSRIGRAHILGINLGHRYTARRKRAIKRSLDEDEEAKKKKEQTGAPFPGNDLSPSGSPRVLHFYIKDPPPIA
jgi:hypothetical protein